MKTIVHIDLNCFFAQVEMLSDPSLVGKPIAIGNDSKRGVISTSSYEARKCHVYSGMPVSMAKHNCPSLILVTPHYSLYVQYSNRFFGFLKKEYPILEKASIDECYIDMTDKVGLNDCYDYLFDLQMKLYAKTELKCSIGVSDNKFLAKMASDMKKPLGLIKLTRENVPALLWPLKIDSFFGIGKKTAPKLDELGIHTIGDLASTSSKKVKALLGNLFDYFQSEARGYGNDFVDASSFDPKSISAERTFSDDVTSFDELSEMILSCLKDVCDELHRYHKKAICVGIKIRTPDFNTRSKRVSLSSPTDEIDKLYAASVSILDSTYKGQPVRLLGVFVDRVVIEEKKEDSHKLVEKFNKAMDGKANLMTFEDLMHEKGN